MTLRCRSRRTGLADRYWRKVWPFSWCSASQSPRPGVPSGRARGRSRSSTSAYNHSSRRFGFKPRSPFPAPHPGPAPFVVQFQHDRVPVLPPQLLHRRLHPLHVARHPVGQRHVALAVDPHRSSRSALRWPAAAGRTIHGTAAAAVALGSENTIRLGVRRSTSAVMPGLKSSTVNKSSFAWNASLSRNGPCPSRHSMTARCSCSGTQRPFLSRMAPSLLATDGTASHEARANATRRLGLVKRLTPSTAQTTAPQADSAHHHQRTSDTLREESVADQPITSFLR